MLGRHLERVLIGCTLLAAGCMSDVASTEAALQSDGLTSGSTCDPANAIDVASPMQRALLDTIAWAEGTRGRGKDGYNVTFAYRYFNSCDTHPNIKVCSGSLCSTAAGRYQFLNRTWVGLKLPTFWPEDQERGALELIDRRGVELPEATLTATEFANALDKLSYEWASLPPGRYGQTRLTMDQVRSEYCKQASCGSAAAKTLQPSAATFHSLDTDGMLFRYRDDGEGGFEVEALSSDWNDVLAMGAGADYDEDGDADFVTVDASGLWLQLNDADTGFSARQLAWRGAAISVVGGAGDYDGDGHADFFAVDEHGQLLQFRGDGSGNFEDGLAAEDHALVRALGGGADLDADKLIDLVSVHADGSVWLLRGRANGQFAAKALPLQGVPLRTISGAVDFDRDGRQDLLGIAQDGRAFIYFAEASGTFEAHELGPGWDAVRFID